MFMPNVKTQRTYHFTNYRHAFMEAFRFDPDKPTSILYERVPDGSLKLVGAMYTAPKRTRAGELDVRRRDGRTYYVTTDVAAFLAAMEAARNRSRELAEGS